MQMALEMKSEVLVIVFARDIRKKTTRDFTGNPSFMLSNLEQERSSGITKSKAKSK